MEVYKIADSIIAARLNDIVARNWYPFKANESITDAEVQLVWDNSAQFSYGVYSFKPEYSEHILKSDTSVLFANGDWTKATVYTDRMQSEDGVLSADSLAFDSISVSFVPYKAAHTAFAQLACGLQRQRNNVFRPLRHRQNNAGGALEQIYGSRYIKRRPCVRP